MLRGYFLGRSVHDFVFRKDRKRDRDSRANDSHSRGNSQDLDTESERGGETKVGEMVVVGWLSVAI